MNVLACNPMVLLGFSLLCVGIACKDGGGGSGDNCKPSEEVANLEDDDCDDEIDNGFKYVFLTSTEHSGDLTATSPIMTANGLEAGDAICQNLADNAVSPLPGTYAAWLSSATVNAIDRTTNNAANTDTYVMPDAGRTIVSVGFQEFFNGLTNPIQVDQDGNLVPPSGNDSFTWTGTFANGTVEPNSHCNSWTDGTDGSGGTIGEYLSTSSSLWTRISGRTCDTVFRIYCFQR